METLAYRDILQTQTQNTNQQILKETISVLATLSLELATLLGKLISGVYLRISSSYCFQLLDLIALFCGLCIGDTIDPNPDLGTPFR